MNGGRAQVHRTESPEETQALAARFAATLSPGSVIALHGNLGAGKTCFVQGLADGLNIRGPVTSPTYTLIQEYDGQPPLYHVDLYRLPDVNGRADTRGLGLDDLFFGDGITAVEWPERAPDLLPRPYYEVRLERVAGDSSYADVRDITIRQIVEGNENEVVR